PRSEKNSPAWISSETPSTAGTEPKLLLTPLRQTIFSKVSTLTMTPAHLVELVSGIRQLIDYIRLSTSLRSEDADQMDKAETDRLLPTGQVH
ncbi:MAG: hypothetical protein EBT93_04645, partial [Alphaproteobacteria bacterium]|nr:hypothetical protein [Alphaproteobacteria bacterium]